MEVTGSLIALISLLFLVSVLSTSLTPRLGIPVLLLFLFVGMLAGEDGLFGLEFEDVRTAHLIGSAALAVILFDGGLRTNRQAFRVGLNPALGLATVGVVVTAAITGAAVVVILGASWLEALLIGAIVGSTDAAAVFALLHGQGMALKERVASTLEIESGANDPMAVSQPSCWWMPWPPACRLPSWRFPTSSGRWAPVPPLASPRVSCSAPRSPASR